MTIVQSIPSSNRFVKATVVVLAVAMVGGASPGVAWAQTQAAKNGPTQLWRTYPLDPHRGEARIRDGDGTRSRQPAQPPPSGGPAPALRARENAPDERRDSAASERSASSSRTLALIVAIVLPLSLAMLIAFVIVAHGHGGALAGAAVPLTHARAAVRSVREARRGAAASARRTGAERARRRLRTLLAWPRSTVFGGWRVLLACGRMCAAAVGAAAHAGERIASRVWGSTRAAGRAPINRWSSWLQRRHAPRPEPLPAAPAGPRSGARVVEDLLEAAIGFAPTRDENGGRHERDATRRSGGSSPVDAASEPARAGGQPGAHAEEARRAEERRERADPLQIASDRSQLDALRAKTGSEIPAKEAPESESDALKQKSAMSGEIEALKEMAEPPWPAEKKSISPAEAESLKEKLAAEGRGSEDVVSERRTPPDSTTHAQGDAAERPARDLRRGAPPRLMTPVSQRGAHEFVFARIGRAIFARRFDVASAFFALVASAAAGAAIALLLS